MQNAEQEESSRIERALGDVKRKFAFAGGPDFLRKERAISVQHGNRFAIGHWETIWARGMLADSLDEFWQSLSSDRSVVLTT